MSVIDPRTFDSFEENWARPRGLARLERLHRRRYQGARFWWQVWVVSALGLILAGAFPSLIGTMVR